MASAVARAALGAATLAVLLAGCRTAPAPAPVPGPGADAPWPEQHAALEKLDKYSLTGRVAVAANGEGFSGGLRYQQQPQSLGSCARRAAGYGRFPCGSRR